MRNCTCPLVFNYLNLKKIVCTIATDFYLMKIPVLALILIQLEIFYLFFGKELKNTNLIWTGLIDEHV